jgi:hypothetical protein
MPELHPNAIVMGVKDGAALIECVRCAQRMRVPHINRIRQRPPRPRAAVPQKTIRFHGDDGNRAARFVEARAQLEHTSISDAAIHAILDGAQANPHIHREPRSAA